MPTIFTRILDRDLPGRIVYEDDVCGAFLTIEPLTPGHTLVVPRAEVDHWIDLETGTAQHLMTVAQRVGQALDRIYSPDKVSMIIAGFDVPHVHIHVVAASGPADLDFRNADTDPDPMAMDAAAAALTRELAG